MLYIAEGRILRDPAGMHRAAVYTAGDDDGHCAACVLWLWEGKYGDGDRGL